MATKNNSPYIPSFLKASLSDSRPLQLTFLDLIDSNIRSTSSFKYDPLDSPLKNTQQLNVDWGKFENHTFFSSAEVKVNVTFDQIINGYPFDGTKQEVERFFESLGGFEKWVFDNFPRNGGQLHFSGTQVGEDPSNGYLAELGTWIKVQDVAGALYPNISKKSTGDSYLNPPENKSFTIEAQVFLPDQSNDRQVILQKSSDDKRQSYTFYIEPSLIGDKYVTAAFCLSSGSVQNSVETSLEKGKFNHVCLTLNREFGESFLQFFVDETLQKESKKDKNFGLFDDRSSLYIGSGSSFYCNNALVYPTQTFSGALDELRIFHSTRSVPQQRAYASKGMYASDALKLYFRFNEPSSLLAAASSDQVNSIVLDSSGNSLHSLISNFDISLRQSSENDPLNPMVNERPEFKVVLFPAHPDIVSLNARLLEEAGQYDEENPNLISKLIPRHYLREGAIQDGINPTALNGSLNNAYAGQGIPGQGQLGSTQIMLSFLYIWARMFDEIKLFVDAFRTLRTVKYDLVDSIPDNFLNDFVRAYGFYLPPFFNSSNVSQYVEGEDINGTNANNFSLKNVQAQLLRRVLINMPDVLRSKGTQHSIRSFLRSVGIDPNNSVRIREFGGPSLRQLGTSREIRTDLVGFADFHTASLITTPFLSASRVEPGYPYPVGPFFESVSSYPGDGLLTSGSWTYEGLYKYNKRNLDRTISNLQSLVRFEVTGSSPSAQPGLILNVVASDSLDAYVRPGTSSNSPTLHLSLPVNILDGNRWYISVGCNRNDSIQSIVSSSYFLRAGYQDYGDLVNFYTTSSYFNETEGGGTNVFRSFTTPATLNASGSRIAIGNNPNIPAGGIGYSFLNNTLDVDDAARTAVFTGQVSNARFWSKGLTEKEAREHVRNHRSLGVEDASVHYNYVTNRTGSFEKLRMSILEKQTIRSADSSGSIKFLDFSENGFHGFGTGFGDSSRVYYGDIVGYSLISPYFDEYSSSEKVRIRGFLDSENLNDSPWAVAAPVHELAKDETPLDDTRFSIEFSLVDTLSRDIVNMFSSLDELGNAVGSPEMMFSPDYPRLEVLSEIYFNRVKEKLNFRSFFEFYRWFDLSIGTFIEQLVPRKTKFKGTNYVIESHLLERHKIQYYSTDMYLGDSLRSKISDSLLVQQVTGRIGKY